MKRLSSAVVLWSCAMTVGLTGAAFAQGKSAAPSMAHHIVAAEQGVFFGWPANNGLWSWDDGNEILVGFSRGNFVEQDGHNIEGKSDSAPNVRSWLARSTDGGLTWTVEDPEHYVGDGDDVAPAPGGIAFDGTGFAMRVVGIGYHGARDASGSFFVSDDRGKTWRGPFRFGSLMDDPNLADMECTSRTGYLVTGKDSCLIFMSARPKENGGGRDKSFVAETTDGGQSFQFVSWIVPLGDPYRAVMPAVARLVDGSIVAALRRRTKEDVNWVDTYASVDNGRTWTFRSRVGETGDHNGNPPALAALQDGRLACAYADRTRAKLFARISNDGGTTWGDEIVLRDDFQLDAFDDNDYGYPRMTVNPKGEIVCVYYWATKERPEQHIAATLLEPAGVLIGPQY